MTLINFEQIRDAYRFCNRGLLAVLFSLLTSASYATGTLSDNRVPASDVGPWNHPVVQASARVISNGGSKLAQNADLQLDGLANTSEIEPWRLSGSWYNPERNYEGFEFQALDNGQFLIIFYTYPGPSDDESAEQSFILGVGTLEGNRASIEGAYRTGGPVFGTAYDKRDLVIKPWGDFTIEFFDENSARVEFSGVDGSGATDVQRLTSIIDPATADTTLPPGVSGTWYDPGTDGQGWFVEIISSTQALVYWFTYDDHGNQAWSLGVGDIVGSSIVIKEVVAGRGSRFGDAFDSNEVTLDVFASMALEFFDCEDGRINYYPAGSSNADMLPLKRLARLSGYPCDGELPEPGGGKITLMSNATDPVLSALETPGGLVIEHFGQRNEEGGIASESGAKITLPNGEVVDVRFRDADGHLEVVHSDTGLALTYADDGNGGVTIEARDPDSGASAIYHAEVINPGVTSGSLQSKGSPPVMKRVTEGSEPQSASTTSAKVTLEYCGERVQDANVRFTASPTDPSLLEGLFGSYDFAGAHAGNGEYLGSLLESDAAEIETRVLQEACEEAWPEFVNMCAAHSKVSWFGNLDPMKSIPKVGDPSDVICAALAAGAAFVTTPLGGSAVGAACKVTDFIIEEVCRSYAYRQVACNDSPDILFRELVSGQWEVSGVASIPNSTASVAFGPVNYPPFGGTLDYGLQTMPDEGAAVIGAAPVPGQPIAGDEYKLEVDLGCASQGDNFRVLGLNPDGPNNDELCLAGPDGEDCQVFMDSRSNQTHELVKIVPDDGASYPLAFTRNIVFGLPAPQPLSPDGGSQPNLCDSSAVTWGFDWSDVTGAIGYMIEVNGPGWSAPPSYSDVSSFQQSQFGSAWADDQLDGWTWRVRAVNRDRVPGPWSAATPFRVQSCATGPDRPILQAPPDNAILPNKCSADAVDWSFQWSTVEGADSYGIEISNYGSYSGQASFGEAGLEPANPSDESMVYSVSLEQEIEASETDNWVWRVWAVDAEGVTSPQPDSERYFTVESCEDTEMSLTGDWTVRGRVDGTDCGEGVYTESYRASVTQRGSSVQVCASGVCLTGSIAGNSVNWAGSYPEDGGTTTVDVRATVSEDFNSLSGSSDWSWTDGQFSCSGTTEVSAERL